MPPRKRVHDAASLNNQPEPPAAKRQRVSLACDSCRTAREKCDGGRPHCGTCLAQHRACRYTAPTRKRGVQTGYLKAIELSLAWLFEQVPECEGALHRLLTENRGADGARILATEDAAGRRLYRRWSKSRVHKDIGRFLSEDKTPRMDSWTDDTDTEGDPSPSAPDADLVDSSPSSEAAIRALRASQAATPASQASRLALPRNWRRLIDIYFSYTHCWLPILDQETIVSTASSYPPEGLGNLCNRSTSALHSQLWAVLALAAFQDRASSAPSLGVSPAQISSTARRLIPPDDGDFEAPHICALLVQSLVLLGQAKNMAAWLLVGKASRLATNHLSPSAHMYPARHGSEYQAVESRCRIFAACRALDALISLRLGHSQAAAPRSDGGIGLGSALPADSLETNDIWTPVSGMGLIVNGPGKTTSLAQSIPTFHQLEIFCNLWNISVQTPAHDTSSPVAPEDLVKGLDPRFAFCNSLIFGGSTPMVPSAYLLQAMFLAITQDLVTGYRPSLCSNLIEVVESCLQNFGACGTPPIMLTLMHITDRHGHVARMHDHDKARWVAAVDALEAVWRPGTPDLDAPEEREPTPGNRDLSDAQALFLDESSTTAYHRGTGVLGSAGASTRPQPTAIQRPQERLAPSYDQQCFPTNSEGSPYTSQMPHPITPSLSFHSPNLGGGFSVPIPQMVHGRFDYDAILDELGSIDCADSIDIDPQFMTNLGFAPGCDLGEMFQGDFGL